MFTLILLINVLEAGILLEFNKRDVRSKVNGICLLICALLTPKLAFQNGLLSFDDKYRWGILNALLLPGAYLFNSGFSGGNIRYSAIFSVLLPSIISTKFSYYWTPLRVYSLNSVFFVDDMFPEIHDRLVKNINHYIEPSDKKI